MQSNLRNPLDLGRDDGFGSTNVPAPAISPAMLDLAEAVSRILGRLPPPSTEVVSLREALGRYAAAEVLSPLNLPGFDNSAMDGYAVRSVDVAQATASQPTELRVIGRTAAGQIFDGALQSGEALRLFTGSPLPKGADAVVMQEDTRADSRLGTRVEILESVKPWENVRFSGEDIRTGAKLLEPGELVSSPRLGLLAAVGLDQVSVGRRPVVSVVASGNELSEPGQPLKPGTLYESNRITLSTALEQAGARVKVQPLLADTLEATIEAFKRGFNEADAVITSGGVSVGELDLLKPAFEAIGGTTQFWKVAIKPGKPFVFGEWKGKFWFGLPGNPVSAWVTLLLLVRPAILKLQGARETALPIRWGKLEGPFSNHGDRRHFVRVHCDATGSIRSAGIQASHMLGSMATANGLLDLAPGTELPAGAWAPFLSID